jgi:addiction module RelE/StbE family toxin
MLKVKYTKPFLKQFKKLSPAIQKKAKLAIKKFEKNPKDKSLKAHKLSGELKDFYSFSVDYKYRIVFEIRKETKEINLLKIGDHKVYE